MKNQQEKIVNNRGEISIAQFIRNMRVENEKNDNNVEKPGCSKTQKESNQERTNYQCNQCDYKAEMKDQLKQHIKSSHVESPGCSKTQKKSIHEKTHYTFNKCDYKAERKEKLKRHIE